MDSWIVAYDISDPKRLRKVATVCEDFGYRKQLSVFFCRLTHVTVFARGGFGAGEVAALTGLRQIRLEETLVRAQLVGLGRPADFTAPLFGGRDGAREWVSATPFVGPPHVGRAGRAHDLRKALRRELRRLLAERGRAVPVPVEVRPAAAAVREGTPRPLEFRRGRDRPGDDGYRRPVGFFRLTFAAPVPGPLSLGYAAHFGLGLFLPAGDRHRDPAGE